MNREKPHDSQRWRRIVFVMWCLLWLLLLAMHWFPIRFTSLRLAMVVGVVFLWVGALCLAWNRKPMRAVLLAAIPALLVICLWPERRDNPPLMQQEYVRALLKYQGTIYVWGGESPRGIDCSGLMRCALIDANIKRCLATFNPSLLREAFSLWWHDASAKALKEGHRNRTRFLISAPTLNQLETSAIRPGDMAVTSNGVHVLAYVGDQTWIEADPNALHGNQVIQVKTPSRNGWFGMPVHLMRWRQLEEFERDTGSN